MHDRFSLSFIFKYLFLVALVISPAFGQRYVITDPTTTTDWVVGKVVTVAWDFNSTDPQDDGNTLKLELYQSMGGIRDQLISTISGNVPSTNRNVSWMVVSSAQTGNNYYVHLEVCASVEFVMW